MSSSRRKFLEGISFASLSPFVSFAGSSGAASAAPAPASSSASIPEPIFPKALKKGDTVALVRPASPSYEYEANEMAAEAVAAMGFVPKMMPNAAKKTNYLAGADAERAADMNMAFSDATVAAVWCISGGYGSSRIIPYLDYGTIRKNPKPFIGFSDITAVHNAIHRVTGLVTFHGPVAGAKNEYALDALRKVVMNGETGKLAENATGEPSRRSGERDTRIYRLAPGKAKGRLVGGNISVLAPLVGTPYEPPLAGRILFLEEVEEDPYRIDRWLTGFLLTGKLSTLSGVALGKFDGCHPGVYKPAFGGLGTWTWQEVCADRFGKLGIPVLAGLSFGHIPENATLPIGAMAELDADAGTLTLLEPAVR